MATTDSTPHAVKNQAYHVGFPILDADGDLVASATGLDSEVSINSGGFVDMTAEAVEETTTSGMYELDASAAEMNGDIVMIIVKSTEGKTTPMVFYPQEAGDIKVDVQSISGDTVAADNLELDYDGTGLVRANSTIGTATALTTNNDKTGYALSAAGVDAIFDEAMSGHVTLGTFGQMMAGLAFVGEVNDAGAVVGDFDVDGFTEATDDHFNGMVMTFTGGALAGQSRVITDYTGIGQNCAFNENWTNAPANNDDFIITPGALAGSDIAKVLMLFSTILDQATGQIDAGSFAAGAIDAAAIATDAIDADAVAADAIDLFWDEAMVEPVAASAPPTATDSFRNAVEWMFVLTARRIEQTATVQTLKNAGNTLTIATAAVSDDATTAVRDEWA